MSLEERATRVLSQLFGMYSAHPGGGIAVDVGAVQDLVRQDAEAVAVAATTVFSSGKAGDAGWSIWVVVANVYDAECDDDSLKILLEQAAKEAGQELPKVREVIREDESPQPPKLAILQMADADVAAGDAHRMEMLFRLGALDPKVRERMIGRCIVTLPAHGDPRPIQHIADIRAFMKDLHRRLPYFPLYLSFEPRHQMHLVYFGCLADAEATVVRPDLSIAFDASHPTAMTALAESVGAMTSECAALGIDCSAQLASLLDPLGLSPEDF